MSEHSKSWDGRFTVPNDRLFEKMQNSLPFDIRLFKEDCELNKAWSFQLFSLGHLTEDEYTKICKGLDDCIEDISIHGLSLFNEHTEDIHMAVEELLSQKIGSIAKKMHYGKSRNDQVATDIRMYLLKISDTVLMLIKEAMQSLLDRAIQYQDIPLPGFTHLQQAQPVLLSHYLLSFFYMLKRDYDRCKDTRKRIAICPLGSAALAGTALPVDREKLAVDLGFLSFTENSMDGVSARDFMLEFMNNMAILSTNLSRFAEDGIIYSSQQFKFFELSDAVSTGSSIMPNKKNPDSLELIRGKTGRIIGNYTALFTVLKGLPSTYNKDLQEDKERLFDTIDTIFDVLRVFIIVVNTFTIHEEQIMSSIDPLSMATELADYLAGRGLPFRDAHHIVGKIVLDCINSKTTLTSLTENKLKGYSPQFDGITDDWGSLDAFYNRRNVSGGTGKNSVSESIKNAKTIISQL